jgi:hypothetical protein
MAFVFVIEHRSSLYVFPSFRMIYVSDCLNHADFARLFKRAKTKRPSTQRHPNFASSHSQPCLANSPTTPSLVALQKQTGSLKLHGELEP